MKIYKDHKTRGIFIESKVLNIKNRSYGFPNKTIFNVSSLIMMDNTWKYFILAASTLVIIFVSTFRSEVGCQFSKEERFFPFSL